jgi:hypothetical protein
VNSVDKLESKVKQVKTLPLWRQSMEVPEMVEMFLSTLKDIQEQINQLRGEHAKTENT